jgi:hypothetical protein
MFYLRLIPRHKAMPRVKLCPWQKVYYIIATTLIKYIMAIIELVDINDLVQIVHDGLNMLVLCFCASLTTEIPIQNIVGKLPVVPIGDTGTIPHHLLNLFSRSAKRLQAGCLLWMPDVVCQLVGIGMVLWYVMI